jgi:uncharacterized delta-60 repeat protein
MMQEPKWLCRSAVFGAMIVLASWAHAQEGTSDPGFGNGGRTWIDVTPSTTDTGDNLIRLPNGNFFMGGACNSVACATWLSPSGAYATGYGTSGTGTALFSAFSGWPSDEDGIADAAAFSDGRVVVALTRGGGSGYVAVLKADGTGLDPAVGAGAGYVSVSFTTRLVRVTPQQQVIVAGSTQASPTAIVFARYDTTMHSDTSFGTGGSTTIGFTGANTILTGMTLQKDSKIVAVALIPAEPKAGLGIVRLTSGGTPDPDFGTASDGRFASFLGINFGVSGADIAVDQKGRLVIVGEAFPDGNVTGKWFVDRLLGSGGVDMTFNGGQPRQFTLPGSPQGYPAACCVALQSDGRIVVAGSGPRDNVNKYLAIARFMDDGSFDSSFGDQFGYMGGEMSSAANVLTDSPRAMVIVPGGIVVGGSTTVSGGEIRFSAAKVRIDLLYADGFE